MASAPQGETDLKALNKVLSDAIEQAQNKHHERWRDLVVETLKEMDQEQKRHADCAVVKQLPDNIQSELKKRLESKGMELYDPLSCGNNSTTERVQPNQTFKEQLTPLLKNLEEGQSQKDAEEFSRKLKDLAKPTWQPQDLTGTSQRR